MLSARFHDWKSRPSLEEAPEPQPAHGESLVEISAAPLTHLDLTIAGGEFPLLPSLPYIGGSEGSGRVLESESFRPGETVRIHGAGVGVVRDGTWAERAAIPDAAIASIPAGTEMALAASFFSPALTAYAAVRDVGRVAAGDRVAVTGAAGCVGTIAAQMAQGAGASTVIAIARDRQRAALLPEGAEPVALDDPTAIDRIRGADGVDVLIDTVGGPQLPTLLAGAMRHGGRAVLVGYAAGANLAIPLPALMAADVSLHPINMMNRHPALEPQAAQLLEDLERGELVMPLTRIPLSELPAAFERLRAGAVEGRIVAEMNSEPVKDR